MKKIIILVGVILIALGVSGGIAYLFIFNNDDEQNMVTDVNGSEIPDSLADSISFDIISSDTVIVIDETVADDTIDLQAVVDSLYNQMLLLQIELDEYKYENSRLKKELEISKQQAVSIKGLSKTYESMKPKEMKPILSNLDDGTIIAIYNSMSNRNKKMVFQALTPKRAAEITEKLAGIKEAE